MPRFRVCKSFTVESGHMLSKHAEGCRHPHGHSRRIDLVVSSESLDENEMVVDFKALKLALKPFLDRYDHALCVNSTDPLLPALTQLHGEATLIYANLDPTTEVMAKEIFDYAVEVLAKGFVGAAPSGVQYQIVAGRVRLDRVRVTETDSSWAEYGHDEA